MLFRTIDTPAAPSRPADRRARDPHARASRRWSASAALLVALGLALSACATGRDFSDRDVRLSPVGDTLYVFARSGGVSRNLCASLGGDVSRVEGRLAAAEGRTIQLGRARGCYTIRHVIVCAEGDGACLAHEERHRREGNFH
jgi:hypothetical protein